MADYIERLKRLSSDDDLVALYHWFWEHQEAIRQTADEINRTLRLDGEFALKPDLPCQSIGSRKGLLFLLVNPGWNPVLNPKEAAYCRRSKENYVDLMFNFFSRHPQVVGQRIRFTAQMISLIGVLHDGKQRFGLLATPEERWRRAQEAELLGHWELFPFHSAKDDITRFVPGVRWLSSCLRESALAALRYEPECLLAMSKQAWHFLRNELLPESNWTDHVVGSPPTKLSYCVVSGRTRNTEVVALARQFLSTRRRICTNHELYDAVHQLRHPRVDALHATTAVRTRFEPRAAQQVRTTPNAKMPVARDVNVQRSVRFYRRSMTGPRYVPRPNSQTELIEGHLSSGEWKSAEQIHRVIQGEGNALTLARIKQHLDWHAERGRLEVEERADPQDGPRLNAQPMTGK